MNWWDKEPENVSHMPGVGSRATACCLTHDQFGTLHRQRGHTAGRKPTITCVRCIEVTEQTYGPRLQQVCSNAGISYERDMQHRYAEAPQTRPSWDRITPNMTLCGLDLDDPDTQMMVNILGHTVTYTTQTCPKCDLIVVLRTARADLKVLAE